MAAFDQPNEAKATTQYIYIFGVAGLKLLYFGCMSRWPIKGER